VRQKDVLKCIITVSGGQCVMTDSRILMRGSFAACWVSGTFLIAVCVLSFKYKTNDVTFMSFIQYSAVYSIRIVNVTFNLRYFVLTYRCLHRLAPRYLSDYFDSVADSNRCRLRSSSSSQLVIRRTRLPTLGDRAFPVAGSGLWSSLPPNVTSASLLTVFRKRFKTYLFS